MEDHHVDRLGVEAQQCVKLTSTNRSIGLIALITSARDGHHGNEQLRDKKRPDNLDIRMFRHPSFAW